MRTIAEIRHQNFELIQRSFPSAVAFSNRIDMSQSYLSQLSTKDRDGKPRKNIGEKVARKVELALGLPSAWLDTPQTMYPPDNVAPLPPISTGGRTATSRVSGIQSAMVDTAHRLVAAGLLSDLDCLTLLQGWQPLIAKLNEQSELP